MRTKNYSSLVLGSGVVSEEELAAMGKQAAGFDYLPRISLALVVSDTDEVWIKSTLDSVIGQVYPHLELCICDNNSQRPHVSEVLERYAASEKRIKVRQLKRERRRAEATRVALAMAAGEFVAFLDQGDEIAPDALFRVVELLQGVSADVIYTDEDCIDVSGQRSDPVFRPYWSPDLLLSTAYIGRLCVVRRSLLETTEVYGGDLEGAAEHDMMLRISERTDRVHHLPEVLYHRRKLPKASDERSDRTSSRAIEDALARRGVHAAVEPGLVKGSFRVIRRVGKRLKVSVIISVPAGMTDVHLVEQLKERTSYPIHQVIVASAGRVSRPSTDHVSHPFPAHAVNLAAAKAEGQYLVFMDARAQLTAPEWLLEMLREAQRSGVGTVGCKLLNPAGSMRHGGSTIETSRLTGYPMEPVMEDGHYLPLVDYPFDFGAASAECMMVKRAKFERAGGFDDANLPTAFYDLDLSFRLEEAGLVSVYTPYSRVVCRGVRATPSEAEVRYMWSRWWDRLVRSLYYRGSPLHPSFHGLDKEALFLSARERA